MYVWFPPSGGDISILPPKLSLCVMMSHIDIWTGQHAMVYGSFNIIMNILRFSVSLVEKVDTQRVLFETSV